jgi:hypothetical protein
MKITIQAEGDRPLLVATREIRTGRDVGDPVSVEAGKEYVAEVNDNYHLVIMPGAPADGSQTLEQPRAEPTVAKEDQVNELRDATDDEVLTAYDAGKDADGKFNIGPLNTALAEKGFNPISAERRDTLVKNRVPA